MIEKSKNQKSTKMSKQRKNLRNGLDKPFLRSGFGRGRRT
jgi:hypothetical protein